MPEYMQSVTLSAGKPSEVQSQSQSQTTAVPDSVASSENSHNSNSNPNSNPSSNTHNHNSTTTNHAVSVTTNLVEHSMKKLDLSPVSMAAITNLVLYATNNIGEGQRPAVLIAAIAYLVCDAGATMQRLAVQATTTTVKKDSAVVPPPPPPIKPIKHIRPGGNRNRSLKRKRMEDEQVSSTCSSSSSSIATVASMDPTAEKPASVTPQPIPEPEPQPFDVLSHPVEQHQSGRPSPLPSWAEWKYEKPWGRSMKQIETCCNVSSTAAVKECYKKHVYPKRQELLEVLQGSFDDVIMGGCQVDVMMGNIAVAAPLMNGTLR